MEKKSVFKLKIGEVYKPIVEDFSRYEDSIFKSTYDKALLLVKEISEYTSGSNKQKIENYSDEEYNNIIAFIGERGTGKTSAMNSFSNLLEDECFLKEGHFKSESIRFYPMGMIDPSQFEKQVNIIELILAKMFKNFKYKAESRQMDTKDRHELIGLFDKVYNNLKCLKNSHEDLYQGEALEGLIQMSASMEIKGNIRELVKKYLDLVVKKGDDKGNGVLVIQIDDIDLNTTFAYDMVEQIRKYLTVPRVVILMALKMDQLHDVVNQAHYKALEILSEVEEIQSKVVEMTEKYLSKLIPIDHRLVLPEVVNFIDSTEFFIESPDGCTKESYPSLEHGVREMIYLRTGLHFINTDCSENFIVPQNLRELANFVQYIRGLDVLRRSSSDILKQCLMDITGFSPEKLKESLEASSLTLKDFSWFLDCPKGLDLTLLETEKDLDWQPIYSKNKEKLEKYDGTKNLASKVLYEKIRKVLDEEEYSNEKNKEKLLTQLEDFKRYFLTYWCPKNLSFQSLELINRFLDRSVGTKNKFLISELQKSYKIKEILEKEIEFIKFESSRISPLNFYYSDLKEKLQSLQKVIAIFNQSENISVGDVLFALYVLKTIDTSKSVQVFIFAIKTIYMMEIFQLNHNRSKSLVDRYNDVETLLGGEYFSSDQKNILPKEGGVKSRDTIEYKWSNLKDEAEQMDEEDKKHTLWFMNLMIKRAVYKPNYRTEEGLFYAFEDPSYGRKNIYEFSIMSPFFNSSLADKLT